MSELKLQESRKKSIPELVDKYKKLVENIFEAVTQPLPAFRDIQRGDEEDGDTIMITAEQQMFAFINVRNNALDNANNMLIKINMLEMELNAPEMFEAISKATTEPEAEKTGTNPAKRQAQKRA